MESNGSGAVSSEGGPCVGVPRERVQNPDVLNQNLYGWSPRSLLIVNLPEYSYISQGIPINHPHPQMLTISNYSNQVFVFVAVPLGSHSFGLMSGKAIGEGTESYSIGSIYCVRACAGFVPNPHGFQIKKLKWTEVE